MKTILVPTDFSTTSLFALDLAYEIALKNDFDIKLLHVLESTSHGNMSVSADFHDNTLNGDVYMIKLIERSKEKLENIISKEKYSNVNIEAKLQIGNIYSNIASELTENEVDMIVLGSKGVSSIDEMVVGSNAEKVIRYASCPVITVKGSTKLSDLKQIVFATNFMDEDDKLISNLKFLQKFTKAKIHFVKVNTPSNFSVDKANRKLMNEFMEKYSFENASFNIYNELDEEEGIISFAEEIEADLIALGTHGRTGIFHLLSGSIAEDVVNHSKMPIWTFRINK